MGWNEVDDKHKKKFDREYISCEDIFEKNFIVDTICDECDHNRADVYNAVINCCLSIPTPRSRKNFLDCVKSKLN